MNKPSSLGVGALSVAAAAMVMFGSGTASAINEYVGQTYDQASQAINGYGGTAVIASRTGEALQTGSCMVVGSHNTKAIGSSGFAGGTLTMLNLDCNQQLANPGHPGNSAASPQGKQVKKQLKDLEWLNENPDQCQQYFDYCKQLCDQYASQCSSDVSSITG